MGLEYKVGVLIVYTLNLGKSFFKSNCVQCVDMLYQNGKAMVFKSGSYLHARWTCRSTRALGAGGTFALTALLTTMMRIVFIL